MGRLLASLVAAVLSLAVLSSPPAGAVAPGTVPGCADVSTTTKTRVHSPSLTISPTGTPTVTSTIAVTNPVLSIYDVDIVTNLEHSFPGDLDVTLTSPAGTVVTLTSDNGSSNDNVFAGTTWDDSADPTAAGTQLVTRHTYANAVTATPLVPEEPLGAFIGESALGTWTLTVSDDSNGLGGQLASWSLIISGSTTPAAGGEFVGVTGPPVTTADNATVNSTLNISGAAPYLADLQLQTLLSHNNSQDLTVLLISPSGTTATLASGVGSTLDNIFAGTTWLLRANLGGQVPYVSNQGLVTDSVFANNTLATPLTPQESFATMMGENPNGTWTLRIIDANANGSAGQLSGWSIFAIANTCNDLAVFLSATQDPTEVGEPMVYNAQVQNRSGDTAIDGVSVSLPLPAGVNFSSVDAPGFACTTPAAGASGTVDCTKASVAAGAVHTIAVTAVPTAVGVVTATASVDATPDDLIESNDVSTRSRTVVAPAAAPVNPGPLPNCQGIVTRAANEDNVALPTGSAVVTTSTIDVAGAPTVLTDLDVTTGIVHSSSADLDMTLTSPAGTVVTLTTDNGSSSNNVFLGTVWDDDANPGNPVPYTFNPGLVTDRAFADEVAAARLTPEEALAAFNGENPNGTWTLTISDDAAGNGGALTDWALGIAGVAAAPAESTASAANTTDTPIVDVATTTSTIEIAGAGAYLTDVNALTKILHTFPSDLDIALRSPQGTAVTLSTDNGSSSDNVFNGTTWDDDANPAGQVPYTNNAGLAADQTYANNVTATPLVPEEPFGAFIGENPNGTWTLIVSDDAAGIAGTLDEWSLDLKTAACAPPPAPTVTPVPTATPTATLTAAKLVLSALKVAPKSFRTAATGPSTRAAKAPIGAKVSYTLAGAAAPVRFAVARVERGRSVGSKCVKQTSSNRRRKACDRFVAVSGTFTQKAKVGTNSIKFTGRLKNKRLKPGSYRLRAVAGAGATASKPADARFKIVR